MCLTKVIKMYQDYTALAPDLLFQMIRSSKELTTQGHAKLLQK
jgi:hypothetical protein